MQTKRLWQSLTRDLVSNYGLYPILTVATPLDAGDYLREIGSNHAYAIVRTNNFYSHVVSGGDSALSEVSLYREIERLERTYDFSAWRDMVLVDRHFGRGFTTGARGFPRSRVSEKATPRLMLEACLASWSFWSALAERFPPALVLAYASGGGITGLPYTRLARQRGIPFRNISYSRFNDRFYWADSADAFAERFDAHFQSIPLPDNDEITEIGTRVGPQVLTTDKHIVALKSGKSWTTIAFDAFKRTGKHLYGRYRGRGRLAYGYLLGSTIASRIRGRTHKDHIDRITARGISQIANRKLVYFALQTEPESTTYIYAAYASDQLNLLRECALSLPSEAVLVVKEHPWQIGHRDKAFYEEIRRLPNVLFVHPDFPSIELVRRSVAVCTTSGSVAYQAAALGVYAFHCQQRSLLDVLPHTIRLHARTDYDRLRDAVRDDDPASLARRQRNGARFYKALETFGFASGPAGLLVRKVGYAASDLAEILGDLEASLPGGLAAMGMKAKPGASAP